MKFIKKIKPAMWLVLPGGNNGPINVDNPGGFGQGANSFGADPTLGQIVGTIVKYVMAFSGFILLILIIFGGFTLLTSAGNPDKVKKGQSLLVSALIGFAIIFVAYWLMQIIEIIFGIRVGFTPTFTPPYYIIPGSGVAPVGSDL